MMPQRATIGLGKKKRPGQPAIQAVRHRHCFADGLPGSYGQHSFSTSILLTIDYWKLTKGSAKQAWRTVFAPFETLGAQNALGTVALVPRCGHGVQGAKRLLIIEGFRPMTTPQLKGTANKPRRSEAVRYWVLPQYAAPIVSMSISLPSAVEVAGSRSLVPRLPPVMPWQKGGDESGWSTTKGCR